MRALLIVLCALGSLVGLFVGGCGLVVAGIGAASWTFEPVVMAAVVMSAGAAIMLVNFALIDAVRRGHTAGRRGVFLSLACLDFFVAYSALSLGNDPRDGAWVGVPLALKGLLTIVVLLRGSRRSPDEVTGQTGDSSE
jgi:hypothetical protein